MAIREFWIQIENNPWDMNPNDINRMTGQKIADLDPPLAPIPKTLTSPVTGITRNVDMNEPVEGDALILRRYTEDWAAPDDRKVNPWDLNERDPTDSGTMGTIPGATIECNVGDKVIVHFRNKDGRGGKSVKERSHSLHPHGIVFAPEYDGAFPLSPPDLSQPVLAEAALWDLVGVTGGFKQGDRVPPGGTFTYEWDTFGWPSTAGVWLYHDHSVCDHHNVELGAIGFLVIHNPDDEDDVLAYDDEDHPDLAQDLPRGNPNGWLTHWCFLPLHELAEMRVPTVALQRLSPSIIEEIKEDLGQGDYVEMAESEAAHHHPHFDRLFAFEGNPVEVAIDHLEIRAFFRRCYIEPPKRALYLQLYHEMPGEHGGVPMTINGRRWLGNTPTLLGGLDTKMRFGFIAMNNNTFHTFHLHAHRWVVPGPSGGNVGGDVPPPGTGVQVSPLNQGASQFEDTRIFGPANSFSFTINQGSFMGPPLGGGAKGEWHMHCHVLDHMMMGMMGSLLIVEGGDVAKTLPRGFVCPEDGDDGELCLEIDVENNFFDPDHCLVPSGTTVEFNFNQPFHTVTTVSTTGTAGTGENPGGIEINGGATGNNPTDNANDVPAGTTITRVIIGSSGDEINYECGIHHAPMTGKITIV